MATERCYTIPRWHQTGIYHSHLDHEPNIPAFYEYDQDTVGLFYRYFH